MPHSSSTLRLFRNYAAREGDHVEAAKLEARRLKAETRECARARDLGAAVAAEDMLARRFGRR